MKNKETGRLFEEEQYRRQLMLSHGILGSEVILKYDTGVKRSKAW